MTLLQPSTLPFWIYQPIWSALAVLIISLMGQFLRRLVCGRLARWASQTKWKWDDAVVEALGRGIPVWSFLFGLYVATGFWEWTPYLFGIVTKLLFVMGWVSVTVVAAGLAGRLVVLYGSQFADAVPVTSLTENIARVLVVILGLLMILNGLGVSITPLLTALGVGGLAVALALQTTLSNFFAGFYMTLTRQIRVGDYIKLESGQEGYVEDIGWRATTIRMLPNNMVLVPNNKLGEAIIINFNLPSRDLAVIVEVGVEYDSDLERVERVTCEVARDVMRTVEGGVPDFEPFVRFHTFGPSSINGSVILRAKEFVDQYLIKHEFIKRLKVRYQKEGIVIPYPIQMVYTKASV